MVSGSFFPPPPPAPLALPILSTSSGDKTGGTSSLNGSFLSSSAIIVYRYLRGDVQLIRSGKYEQKPPAPRFQNIYESSLRLPYQPAFYNFVPFAFVCPSSSEFYFIEHIVRVNHVRHLLFILFLVSAIFNLLLAMIIWPSIIYFVVLVIGLIGLFYASFPLIGFYICGLLTLLALELWVLAIRFTYNPAWFKACTIIQFVVNVYILFFVAELFYRLIQLAPEELSLLRGDEYEIIQVQAEIPSGMVKNRSSVHYKDDKEQNINEELLQKDDLGISAFQVSSGYSNDIFPVKDGSSSSEPSMPYFTPYEASFPPYRRRDQAFNSANQDEYIMEENMDDSPIEVRSAEMPDS